MTHDGPPVEPGEARHDGRVVGEAPVPVQLLPVGEEGLDVVQGVGALGVAGDLHRLPRRELGEDLLPGLLELLLEGGQLLVAALPLAEEAEVLDLRLELLDGPFEFAGVLHGSRSPVPTAAVALAEQELDPSLAEQARHVREQGLARPGRGSGSRA